MSNYTSVPVDPAALAVTSLTAAPVSLTDIKTEGETPASAGRSAGPAKCLVPGCTESLSDQCSYNKRYKICGVHRSMLSIDINGKEMRFCQQCARLQEVDKFKGDRRSCHERLEIHNKRRAQGKNASPAVVLGHLTKLRCQVPECTENLLDHKAYNQRYKICPFHRTREELVINGQSLRFCQQCAKLHSVSDFEGTKRSCKDKLMKHNNRRLLLKRTLEEREAASGQPHAPGAYCQVPGCQQDLRDMKVYNIRYKVCAEHLTMPEVEIKGEKVRFCQQCARFQPVDEFDSLKRSCRARLEKHNQRAAQQKGKTWVNIFAPPWLRLTSGCFLLAQTAGGAQQKGKKEDPGDDDVQLESMATASAAHATGASAPPGASTAAPAAVLVPPLPSVVPPIATDTRQVLSAIQSLLNQQQQATGQLPPIDHQALHDIWAQASATVQAATASNPPPSSVPGGAPAVMMPNLPMMNPDGSVSASAWLGSGLVPIGPGQTDNTAPGSGV
eukprot:CAMPEP_0117693552 /NCGR_PEP_ID=MMETSP0804-20121206/26945_1 /TAXON_ID=1074897 /ORGANISM="Tetraselmis astigmatica, Strain CCMP880" /LENGTH=499 /DNA_ID=CAMNT_0005507121 /DNA_START=129 /DNA_END=1629 /DNA_ORIENTATION=-